MPKNSNINNNSNNNGNKLKHFLMNFSTAATILSATRKGEKRKKKRTN